MDSPNSDDANKQIVLVPTKEEQGSTSMEYENEAPAAAADEMLALPAPPGFENYQLAIVDHDHDREYGCRYCDKRFSNKQALGGHQNAHKVERSMEKNDHDTSIDFFPGPNQFPAPMNMPPGPFLNSYPPRPSDFLNRSLFAWSCGGGGAGGIITYNPRPTEHGFNCIYQGWSAPPCPRIPQFVPPHPHYMLPPQNLVNIRLPNFGPGSAAAFRNAFNHQGPPGFARFGVRPGGGNWPAAPVNLRNVPGVSYDEYAGLDLSLKLG